MSFRLRPVVRRIMLMILTGAIGVIVIKWFFPSESDIDHRPTWWLVRDAANSAGPGGFSDFDLAMQRKGPAAIPDLVEALDKKDTGPEHLYAWLYSHLPENLKSRIPPPANPVEIHRVAALHLSVFPSHAKMVVPQLMNETLSTNFFKRQSAIRALAAIGPDAIDARPRLARLLQDYDPRIRMLAAGALANVDPAAHEALVLLVSGLSDTNSRVRSEAMEFFGASSKYERLVQPSLVEALATTNNTAVSFIVEQMNRDMRAVALPVLLNALDNERQSMVIPAIAALERYGPRAHAAIPKLLRLSGDPLVKQQAERALNAIAIPTSGEVTGIVEVLRSTNDVVRFNTVELLSYLPVDPAAVEPLVGELNSLLEARNPKLRVFAARAIWKINGEVKAPCKVLEEELENPDTQIQRYAWLILKEIAASNPLIKVSAPRPE